MSQPENSLQEDFEADKEIDEYGIDKLYSTKPEPVSINEQANVTLNAQFNQVDKSLHLHQAMLLPDAGAAERFQALYPPFMSEVMEGRRREQRARLMGEKRAQEFEAEANLLHMKQAHERVMQTKNLEHHRFNSAVTIMALISLIFAIVGAMSHWRGMYWPAGAMGAAMALTFQRITTLLSVSK